MAVFGGTKGTEANSTQMKRDTIPQNKIAAKLPFFSFHESKMIKNSRVRFLVIKNIVFS